jgi:hypothetical protein
MGDEELEPPTSHMRGQSWTRTRVVRPLVGLNLTPTRTRRSRLALPGLLPGTLARSGVTGYPEKPHPSRRFFRTCFISSTNSSGSGRATLRVFAAVRIRLMIVLRSPAVYFAAFLGW